MTPRSVLVIVSVRKTSKRRTPLRRPHLFRSKRRDLDITALVRASQNRPNKMLYAVGCQSRIAKLKIEGLKSQILCMRSPQSALWRFKSPRGRAQFSRLNSRKFAAVAGGRMREVDASGTAAGLGGVFQRTFIVVIVTISIIIITC